MVVQDLVTVAEERAYHSIEHCREIPEAEGCNDGHAKQCRQVDQQENLV
jgi:hypothetical protein